MSKMKHSPYKLLICIVEKGHLDLVLNILNNAHEAAGVSTLVEGTSKLGVVQNIIGLAKNPRVMLSTFIRSEHATRTIQALDLVLCPDDVSYGIAMTIDLSSISREALNYIISRKGME